MRLVFGNLRQTQLAFSARMQTGIHLSLSLHCNFFQHSVTSVVRLGCSFIAAGAGSWRCWTRWQDSHRKTHENLRLICVLKRCRAKQQSFSLSLSDLSPAFPASFSVSLISYSASIHLRFFTHQSPSLPVITLLQDVPISFQSHWFLKTFCDNKEYSYAFAW